MTVATAAIRAVHWDGTAILARFRVAPRWSLARQYLAASLLVVLTGVVITGAWIGHQIEARVLDRTARISALYIGREISPNLQSLSQCAPWLRRRDTPALDHL